jgi:hypothetical protein
VNEASRWLPYTGSSNVICKTAKLITRRKCKSSVVQNQNKQLKLQTCGFDVLTGRLETAIHDVHVQIIGKNGRSVNLTTNRYIMCRQRAGLVFVVIVSKRPAGHALKTPDVEDAKNWIITLISIMCICWFTLHNNTRTLLSEKMFTNYTQHITFKQNAVNQYYFVCYRVLPCHST